MTRSPRRQIRSGRASFVASTTRFSLSSPLNGEPTCRSVSTATRSGPRTVHGTRSVTASTTSRAGSHQIAQAPRTTAATPAIQRNRLTLTPTVHYHDARRTSAFGSEDTPMRHAFLAGPAIGLVLVTVAPTPRAAVTTSAATVNHAVAWDRSPALAQSAGAATQARVGAPAEAPKSAEGARVEQTSMGTAAASAMVASFDGLGVRFEGPQGTASVTNPSDNSLAVGPDHIGQTVNTRTAIFTKSGKRFDTTGRVLYGPVPNNNFFRGFSGTCEATNNGDTVVRYDQLADRWLIVMPIFRRAAERPDQPPVWKGGTTVYVAPPGVAGQPGRATALFVPPPPPPPGPAPAGGAPARGAGAGRGQGGPPPAGPYAMCYAVSATSDPMGEYFRYEFLRPLFPDYPRPAVWPDGYYVPTSTSDDIIEKHACVVDRARMLKGEPATEQCVVIDGVNFLNNADLDGPRLPPAGAPNPMLATGGAQLNKIFGDDGIFVWQFKVDWQTPANTKVTGPVKLPVAPYQFLCRGQLSDCVPQPDTDRRLDAQGDKLMARVVYRNLGARESIVATHSVNTEAATGGVRWYEFDVTRDRSLRLRQQGTYAPDGGYRWLPSP